MANATENRETTKHQTQQGDQQQMQSGAGTQSSQGRQQQMQQTAGRQGTGQRQQAGLSRREQSAPLIPASPFGFMRRFGEEMDRLFGDYGSGWLAPANLELASWAPEVEVFERDGQLVVRAALPGLSKDDVQVELRDDAVILRGERRQEHEERDEGYYRSELSYGAFYREIPLPDGINADEATATFRDGVLEITMPAPKQETQGRQLQIQDGAAGGEQQSDAQAAGSNR